MAPPLERHDANAASPTAIRLLNDIRAWIQKDSVPFATRFGYTPSISAEVVASKPAELTRAEPGQIVLIQQFYVSPSPERHAENVACLRFNLDNEAIDRIVLLNEREYSDQELGIQDASCLSKLEQVVIGHRLTYLDAFSYCEHAPDCFVVLANTDIFLDAAVTRIRRCGLGVRRRVLCQLRHEFSEGKELGRCLPFGSDSGFPCQSNSQDAWIWHTRHGLPRRLAGMFQLELGTPGCDNAIAHRFGLAGFERMNLPATIPIYHNHRSQLRSYHLGPVRKCPRPYQLLIPSYSAPTTPPSQRVASLDRLEGNLRLAKFIEQALEKNIPFLLPRVAGIENDVAALGAEMEQNRYLPPDRKSALDRGVKLMAAHAGVHLPDRSSVIAYARAYLAAFAKSDAYFAWAPWGNVSRHYAMSFTFIESNFTQPTYDAGCLDVFDCLWAHPWTWALKGKRILIVSPFAETIKKQLDKPGIYPVDLFPECTFTFVVPPQTHGGSPGGSFAFEMRDLLANVRGKLSEFDVALCSCGGYGNPLCHAIRQMGKSAIYVGGVLQMYFGVLGTRWERERPEIVEAYKTADWTRPDASGMPPGHKEIEDGCYW